MKTARRAIIGEAAGKLKAQPEVARGLKQIGKKRSAHLNKLDSL